MTSAPASEPPFGYCPYDVVPLGSLLDGRDVVEQSAFGALHAFLAPGDGPPGGTLLLHGVHDNMSTWAPMLRTAAELGIDLGPMLFVDLPGFGRSENDQGRLDLAEVGDVVLDLARRHLGEHPVRLVGHSMGTLVAADLAVRRPDELASLHLASGPYYSVVDTMNGRLSDVTSVVAGALFGSQYVLAMTGPLGVGGARAAERLGLLRPMLRPYLAHPDTVRTSVIEHALDGLRPAAFRAAARNGFRYRAGMSWRAITVPVHAVFGALDRLVPRRDGDRLAAEVSQARVTVLDDAAHLVHIEQPSLALDALGLS